MDIFYHRRLDSETPLAETLGASAANHELLFAL
jgi:hypothetical protein